MNHAEEYASLSKRRNDIATKIAVMESQENEKKAKREALEEELRAAGIDTDSPQEEIERLQREIEDDRKRIDEELTTIENQLAGNQTGATPEPIEADGLELN